MTSTRTGAISFDLFGTLIDVSYPEDPAADVADELRRHGVSVPGDWRDAYHESHIEVPDGAEISLFDHVDAALASRGVKARYDDRKDVVRKAVLRAFATEVQTRSGAVDAVRAASERAPVGVLSNCSVPGLVQRTVNRSELDSSTFDAIVASVDCGWRKPDERAFETIADRLGVDAGDIVHVGDDPRTDGGASRVGATAVLTDDHALSELHENMNEII